MKWRDFDVDAEDWPHVPRDPPALEALDVPVDAQVVDDDVVLLEPGDEDRYLVDVGGRAAVALDDRAR